MVCRQATYSGDPSTSKKDEVRFWLGDTNVDRPLFFDSEVEYVVQKIPNTRMAAASLLEIKAQEFARKADIRVGDVSKSYSKAADSMKKFADSLKDDALKNCRPFFGGLTKSGKLELAGDSDAIQPQFFIGQTDNPFAAQMNRDVTDLYGLVGTGGL